MNTQQNNDQRVHRQGLYLVGGGIGLALMLILIAMFGGCDAVANLLNPQRAPQALQAATPTKVVQAAVVPTQTPWVITATPALTTAQKTLPAFPPSATSAPAVTANCQDVTVVSNNSTYVLKDLGGGDPWNYFLYLFGPTEKPEHLIVGDPMVAFDIENLRIFYTVVIVSAPSLKAAVCYADDLAKNNGVTDKVYVGTGQTPAGYTRDGPVGWNLRITPYDEKPISYGGTTTELHPVVGAEKQMKVPLGSLLYCQTWNPTVADYAAHFLVSPGFTMIVPAAFQGTCWQATGADVVKFYARANQARAEVLKRDKNPKITSLWCGQGNGPDSWEPKPWIAIPFISAWPGWDCQKN